MQDTTVTARSNVSSSAARARRRRQSQLWTVVGLFVLLLSLALFPPLLNLGRYQRRIAKSISLSLGRPVHLDRVTLNLLPLPSLSIENFVVDEDPAFGDEPILRANTVVANLRVSSLWRRQVEVSSLHFQDPSVNLVLRQDGRWNVEDVLLQAAHIDAAPTAQRRAGATPRFPYIEATGARLNLKLGNVKTPFSLSEADFALFLPEPQEWRMRLKAKPVRTDTSASDTGVVEAEATLRRASTLERVPITFAATWRNAPLGETSRILFRRDLGLRGSMRLSVASDGTLGQNALHARVELLGLHRSDFVPADPLQIKVDCVAEAQRLYHALRGINCGWPVPDGGGAVLALTGAVPDLLHLSSADLQVGTGGLPAAQLLHWARAFSSRIPPGTTLQGELSASFSHLPGTPPAAWSGRATLDGASLRVSTAQPPLPLGTVLLTAATTPPQDRAPARPPGTFTQPSVEGIAPEPELETTAHLAPMGLPLGGTSPAMVDGSADRTGYSLHLTGSALSAPLESLLAGFPPLQDGFPPELLPRAKAAPLHLDLTVSRAWGGPQAWTNNLETAASVPPPERAGRQRVPRENPLTAAPRSDGGRERSPQPPEQNHR